MFKHLFIPQFKRLFAKLGDFLGRCLCAQGFHKWAQVPGQPSSRYCTRQGCLSAQVRSAATGIWANLTRQEVTLEQVKRLPRHERRRLGSLARRGAFGPTE